MVCAKSIPHLMKEADLLDQPLLLFQIMIHFLNIFVLFQMINQL